MITIHEKLDGSSIVDCELKVGGRVHVILDPKKYPEERMQELEDQLVDELALSLRIKIKKELMSFMSK